MPTAENDITGSPFGGPLHASPSRIGKVVDDEGGQPLGRVKHRRRTSIGQLKVLERHFSQNPKPDVTVRKVLALELEMTPREVQVWFQNRRAKTKKQLEKQCRMPVGAAVGFGGETAGPFSAPLEPMPVLALQTDGLFIRRESSPAAMPMRRFSTFEARRFSLPAQPSSSPMAASQLIYPVASPPFAEIGRPKWEDFIDVPFQEDVELFSSVSSNTSPGCHQFDLRVDPFKSVASYPCPPVDPIGGPELDGLGIGPVDGKELEGDAVASWYCASTSPHVLPIGGSFPIGCPTGHPPTGLEPIAEREEDYFAHRSFPLLMGQSHFGQMDGLQSPLAL